MWSGKRRAAKNSVWRRSSGTRGSRYVGAVSPHPGSSVSLPFFSHPCGPAPPYPPSSTFSCMVSRCSVAPRCAHRPLTLLRQSTLRRFASPCSCTCATSARLLTTCRVPLMSGGAHTTIGAVLNPPRGGWGGRPMIALLLSQHLNEFIYVNKRFKAQSPRQGSSNVRF